MGHLSLFFFWSPKKCCILGFERELEGYLNGWQIYYCFCFNGLEPVSSDAVDEMDSKQGQAGYLTFSVCSWQSTAWRATGSQEHAQPAPVALPALQGPLITAKEYGDPLHLFRQLLPSGISLRAQMGNCESFDKTEEERNVSPSETELVVGIGTTWDQKGKLLRSVEILLLRTIFMQ